jgi:septal ring factor EnvC (AmiA/AmiB activator)
VRAKLFACLVVFLAVLAAPEARGEGPPDAEAERQLEALKARLSSIEQAQRQASRERDRESRALREAEIAVARESRALEETRRADLAAGLEADSAALAAELRAAWVAGGEPRLKLMLSQQDPAEFGRMLTWYGYVARERAGRVEVLRERLAELAEVSRQLDAEDARLAAAEARQRDAVAALDQARATRAGAVAALDADVARHGREAERLRQEAAALEQLLEELRAAVADLPVPESAPFASQRGSLAWPVKGVVARAFGARRGDGPKSNGVLIAAERGTDVQAVWHGRVAYADWLPGLGLLLVLEHGDGYMSLYAHNEVLFSAVGDWVSRGQVVGRVGDSGGRDEAGLYFEIRNSTQPENPAPWFSAPLPRR